MAVKDALDQATESPLLLGITVISYLQHKSNTLIPLSQCELNNLCNTRHTTDKRERIVVSRQQDTSITRRGQSIARSIRYDPSDGDTSLIRIDRVRCTSNPDEGEAWCRRWHS